MVVYNRVTRNNHCNYIFVYLEWLYLTELTETTIATIHLYVKNGCLQQSYQKPPWQLYICLFRIVGWNKVIRNHHCNYSFVYKEWLYATELPETTMATLYLYI